MTTTLGARDLKTALMDSLDALRASRGVIDAANVYPVPDADTGTNLVMTFEAVARAIADASDDEAIAAGVAEGALHGARGNSGVILAQVLRTWAEELAGGPADAAGLARAFATATTRAYEAILEPAEGTVLSVLAAASEAATRAASAGERDAGALLAAAAVAAREALARTPAQMAVLAEAGVVDAGGMGLVIVLDALARRAGAEVEPFVPEAPAGALLCARDGGDPTFRYEVQYLLAASEASIEPLRHLLGTIGDSVVVIGGDDTWRVHVHTDEPGRARALGEAIGTVSAYEQVDFTEQIAADTATRPQPDRARGARGIPVASSDAAATLIAVAEGEGAAALFAGLGAHVVRGGRDEVDADVLVRALAAAGSPAIVLPNDEEIFARAVELSERFDGEVAVLRTGDQAQGLAVALAYSDAVPFARAAADMRRALERVRSGQVIVAPIPVETTIGRAAAGRAVAFVEGEPVAIEDDPVAALGQAARALAAGAHDVLTILCGADVGEAERARVAERLRAELTPIAVEVHEAGQRRHRYLVAAE